MITIFSTNKKLWLITAGFAALMIILFFILAVGQRSSSNTRDGHLADILYQQEQVYIKSVFEQLVLLAPLLTREVTTQDLVQITAIKNKILALKVPAQYRDWHLQMVLKLSSWENVLAGKIKSKNITSTSLQRELSKLASDFDSSL